MRQLWTWTGHDTHPHAPTPSLELQWRQWCAWISIRPVFAWSWWVLLLAQELAAVFLAASSRALLVIWSTRQWTSSWSEKGTLCGTVCFGISQAIHKTLHHGFFVALYSRWLIIALYRAVWVEPFGKGTRTLLIKALIYGSLLNTAFFFCVKR